MASRGVVEELFVFTVKRPVTWSFGSRTCTRNPLGYRPREPVRSVARVLRSRPSCPAHRIRAARARRQISRARHRPDDAVFPWPDERETALTFDRVVSAPRARLADDTPFSVPGPTARRHPKAPVVAFRGFSPFRFRPSAPPRGVHASKSIRTIRSAGSNVTSEILLLIIRVKSKRLNTRERPRQCRLSYLSV